MPYTSDIKTTYPPRDRYLLLSAFVTFALWLVAISPVRRSVIVADFCFRWVIGVAPSFFAGMTWTFWQAFATRSRPIVSAAYAVVLVAFSEAIQLLIPRYTADVLDITAGAIGASLVLPILFWRLGNAR